MKLTPEEYRKLQKQSKSKLDRLIGNNSGNKYGAKSQHYNGSFYHSTGERDYAMQLDLRVKAKDIKSWRRQVKIEIKVCGVLICNYYCDFLVTHNDNSLEYIEYKGFSTDIYKLKAKLLEVLKEELIPGAKFTVIKHKSKYKFNPK